MTGRRGPGFGPANKLSRSLTVLEMRTSTCTIPGVIMLVKLAGPKEGRDWVSDICFTLIVVAPWAAMIWLLWPRG